jgi:hypothetical protein
VPSARSATSPASLSRRRCRDTAGRLIGSSPASSLTELGFGRRPGGAHLHLAPGTDGTTRFTVREEYTGPLLPLIWRSMPDLGPSFRQVATGLKQRAER